MRRNTSLPTICNASTAWRKKDVKTENGKYPSAGRPQSREGGGVDSTSAPPPFFQTLKVKQRSKRSWKPLHEGKE